MARLKASLFFLLVLVGCSGRSPEFWASYSATVTAAASTGTGGYMLPSPTPHPGVALIGAEISVTQAALNAQSAQTVADQTRTAYQYTVAIASLEAQQALATQVAPTRFAEMTTISTHATATHNAAATNDAVTSTLQAAQVNQVLAMGTAENIVSIAAAQGTATAIFGVAEIEEQGRIAQREELAIANQRARNKATLSFVVPVFITVALTALVVSFAYRVVVQARPQAVDNHKRIITYDRSGNPLLSAPAKQLTVSSEPSAAPEPEAAAPLIGEVVDLPDLLPGVLQVGVYEGGRPVHLGPGFMGIQLTGQKGSGKSSLLRLMAAQALAHGWDVFYADAEALTFNPDLWGPVAQTTADTRLLFAWLRETVFEERHNLYREAFSFVEDNLRPQDRFLIDNLTSYNKAAKLFNLPLLKPMLLVWDEANSHLQDKRVQELAEKAFQASRKVGCDGVVAGHNWRASDIPAGLKLQLHNAIIMRCSEQDSRLMLGDPKLAATIPADSPGASYIRLKRWQGYMQSYYVPDHRLIQMVREARPQTQSHKPWIITKPAQPALEMGVEELFQLDEGEADTRPRKLDKDDPRLRQRVLELHRAEKPDGSRYSGREIELAVTAEFCPGVEPYAGGQAYKIVKEIISSVN